MRSSLLSEELDELLISVAVGAEPKLQAARSERLKMAGRRNLRIWVRGMRTEL